MVQSSPHPKRLGRYEIVGVLAQGGMAELFLAQLPGIQGFAKRVVLKRVLPSLARDREFVEMFLEEARFAATLHHQNIVQVHDIGHDETGYFFTMEYLHGADVGELMRTIGADLLPLPIALEIARLACAGLHYAHQRANPKGQPLGIVHRDVSPQNLFVTFDGNVKVLDFGIAKAVQSIANQYTRSGTLRGKLPYMSPEQCQSEKIDARSDVFSLAVVIWEMTVGRRLFGSQETSDFEILKAIVERDAPRPSSIMADYPIELERIVMRGLARDRAARYQSADELQADLEAFIRTSGNVVTAREMAVQLRTLFADRASASVRLDVAEIEAEAKAGQIVPFPGTAPVPMEVGTVELPIGDPTIAPSPGLHGRPPSRDRASDARDAPGTRSSMSPRQRNLALALAGIGIAALALAIGYRMRGAPQTTEASGGSGGGVGIAAGTASGVLPVAGTPAALDKKTIDAPRTAEGEDAHWFVEGDYLVSEKPLGNGRTKYISVAKLMTAPAETGGPAVFLTAHGAEVSRQHFWATRIAEDKDLVVGAIAFCPVDTYSTRGKLKKSKQDVRKSPWSAGRITDTADITKGIVSIADVVCDVAAARVPKSQ